MLIVMQHGATAEQVEHVVERRVAGRRRGAAEAEEGAEHAELEAAREAAEGQDVRIGPHCRIDTVVAQELVVHESSEVKERRVQNE